MRSWPERVAGSYIDVKIAKSREYTYAGAACEEERGSCWKRSRLNERAHPDAAVGAVSRWSALGSGIGLAVDLSCLTSAAEVVLPSLYEVYQARHTPQRDLSSPMWVGCGLAVCALSRRLYAKIGIVFPTPALFGRLRSRCGGLTVDAAAYRLRRRLEA